MDGQPELNLHVLGELTATRGGALQAYVSHLRRRLEPDATAREREHVIARAGPGYVLRLPHDAG